MNHYHNISWENESNPHPFSQQSRWQHEFQIHIVSLFQATNREIFPPPLVGNNLLQTLQQKPHTTSTMFRGEVFRGAFSSTLIVTPKLIKRFKLELAAIAHKFSHMHTHVVPAVAAVKVNL